MNHYKKIIWGKGENCPEKIPQIVWIYWNSPSYPPLVEICIYQLNRLLTNFKINVVNDNNLKNYLPNIPPARAELPLANYSDLIRLKLLQKYGGYYLDASVLISQNLDWIAQIKQEDQSEIVGFYSDDFTSDWDYPLLETWCLATSPENKFITAWADEYEKCYTSPHPHQYFDEEKKINSFCNKMDEFNNLNLSNYLIAYLAAAKTMRNNSNFRISMISANDVGHYYNFGLKLPAHKLEELFLYSKENPKHIPALIKFENKGRNAINEALNNGRYSQESLLFKIAPQKNYWLNKIPKLPKYFIFIIKNLISKYAK